MKSLKEALIKKHATFRHNAPPKLKISDVVEYRNGSYGIVMDDIGFRKRGVNFLIVDEHAPENVFSKNLDSEWNEQTFLSNENKEYDIIRVYIVSDMGKFKDPSVKIQAPEDISKVLLRYVKKVIKSITPIEINR